MKELPYYGPDQGIVDHYAVESIMKCYLEDFFTEIKELISCRYSAWEEPKGKLKAWINVGLIGENLYWETDEDPPMNGDWRRAPWLDEP